MTIEWKEFSQQAPTLADGQTCTWTDGLVMYSGLPGVDHVYILDAQSFVDFIAAEGVQAIIDAGVPWWAPFPADAEWKDVGSGNLVPLDQKNSSRFIAGEQYADAFVFMADPNALSGTYPEMFSFTQRDLTHIYTQGDPLYRIGMKYLSPPDFPDFSSLTQEYNHLVNRYQIIETIAGVESVLTNYDYPLKSQADNYVTYDSAGRDLRVAYCAEVSGGGNGGHQVFAVLDSNADIVEIKATQVIADGYANAFGYTDVRMLEETTEPSA